MGDGENWRVKALCAQVGPELFFPERGRGPQEAKQVCARCEVREPCLEFALRFCDLRGVWGGYSEKGRMVLKAQRRASSVV